MIRWSSVVIFLFALSISACDRQINEPIGDILTAEEEQRQVKGDLFGNDKLFTLGGPQRRRTDDGAGTGIGVNAFLWRASLDTLSFLPLLSADPFGGVIITDWYAAPEATGERVKVTVLILARQLRSNGVRVSVFRQVLNAEQGWIDTTVDETTATRLEDTILTRARQLRLAQMDN